MATYSSINNSWHQLYTKANNMKLPERELLTRDGVYMKKRPEPEVVEHMLDELETKMRNYFILYNREREFRKKSEENCYRLEQELLNYKQKLDESNNKFHCLERKVKSMVDQPLKLKETIDRIELLYNQMDTLIQAFVGIGSCAVIQGYSRVAFIKLCLEYLYPCRDLDIRLNTLYNALYNVLTQYDGIELTMNEVMKPLTFNDGQEKAKLTGISVKVHRLMLKCDLPETRSFGCFFRYDNESKELRHTDFSRFISVEVRPMDNASKVYEFNSLIQNNTLPPKVPNVVPKLVIDVYADALLVGSAEVSVISEKTLKPAEPWNVLDSNGVNCGDVVVTVIPMPTNAKLPAVNFTSKTDELVSETKTKVELETTQPGVTTTENTDPSKAKVEATNPPDQAKPSDQKGDDKKAFEPKTGPGVRKPLFNPRTGPSSKAGQAKPPGKTSNSNVSRLSLMFSRKRNQAVDEAPAAPEPASDEPAPGPDASASNPEPTPTTTPTEATNNQPVNPKLPNKERDGSELVRQKSTIKEMIIRKLSSRQGTKEHGTESQPQPKVDTTSAPTVPVTKVSQAPVKPVEVNPPSQEEVESPPPTPPQPPVQKTQPAPPPTPPETVPKAPVKAAKLPPEPPRKAVPKTPSPQPVVEPPKETAEKLPDKPLIPIAITPKLLKKPSPPKK